MKAHETLDPPRKPMEYSLSLFTCNQPPGGNLRVTPNDLRNLRYCPFCGGEL